MDSRSVVVGAVDASPQAGGVAQSAAVFAEQNPTGELHLVHVLVELPGIDPIVPMPGDLGPTLIDEGRVVLEDAARVARRRCTKPIRAHLLVGVPSKAIVRELAELGADLAVVGTHDRKGLSHLLLGSVAEHVVRHAPCPVLLVRPKSAPAGAVIEPPCPDCVQARNRSAGNEKWCARHKQHHPHAHLHYEVPESFGVGSMFLRS